jgi:hypothetical protein
MSGGRHLASLLLRHARWMMPASRAAWADGMAHEMQYVGNDREALTWAVGCVFAAYAGRLRSENFLLPRFARLLLAVWCLQFALIYFNQPYSQLAACNPMTGAPCYYQPAALQLLRGIAACCFLLAGLRLVCNRQTALVPYGVALLICFITVGYTADLPQYPGGMFGLGLFSASEFAVGNIRIALTGVGLRLWLGVILPLVFGLAIWLMDHYSEDDGGVRRLT